MVLSGSTFTYQWKRNNVTVGGATASTYTLMQADVGSTITVTVSYTDDLGTGESITSLPTSTISNINDVGVATINGTASQGNTLTASVTDADGTTGSIFIYQWKRDGVDIAGATASTYILVQDDVDTKITVSIEYLDDFGATENIVSPATGDVANTNDIGIASITGAKKQGLTLTAAISDVDGSDGSTFSYQWKRDSVDISGATNNTYLLLQADVGHIITVTISYIDNFGTPESVTSTDTDLVINENDVGIASIIGLAAEGQVLTATITDLDGISGSTFSYQWNNGVTNVGTNSSTYTIASTDIGRTLTVTISYIDDFGWAENITSAATDVVYADLDGDTITDSEDADIDGDGIPNQFEMDYGLDPRDASDAADDLDGDGLTNLEEYEKYEESGDEADADLILVDNNPPLVIAPSDITVNSTGWVTTVNTGTAFAIDTLDGELSVVKDLDDKFRPGITNVVWLATDLTGNVGMAIQKVNVIPMVETSKRQRASEGSDVELVISLNGYAVEYPVIVPYFVNGTAEIDGSDHNIVNSNAVIIEPTSEQIEAGELPQVAIPINIVSDGLVEGIETIVITIGASDNAVLGSNTIHTIEIVEGNIAPVVSLDAFQLKNTLVVDQYKLDVNGLAVDTGFVKVSANVIDVNAGDSHSYNWSNTDNSVVKINSEEDYFVFDPDSLTPGYYTFRVSVSDGIESVNNELMLRVVSVLPVLDILDSDGDGINDETEGFSDADFDGIYDYLDAIQVSNVIQILPGISDAYIMQTEPGLSLSLGDIAFKAGHGGSLVEESDVLAYSSDSNVSADEIENVGGYVDFIITGMSVAGQSVQVVIPQLVQMPRSSVYRKLTATGWQDFVVDSSNIVESVAGEQGYCPPPGDAAYTSGLTQGHWCLQLTIEDGGPNDADGEANNRISDPGGVGRVLTDVNVSSSGSSGGASNPLIPVLSVFIMLTLRNRKRAEKKAA